MSDNVDINKQMLVQHKTKDSKGGSSIAPANTIAVTKMLDQVFDLIFSSSKQVLGNIMSIGIKYGDSLNNPDNMLVVFPQEVYGFQGWNGAKKNKWRYERQSKKISKNGVPTQSQDQQSFVLFVQQGLDAMNEQNVKFSKNITTQELKGLN